MLGMKRILAALLLLTLAAPAWAGWDEGVAAYERGDYATALREFRPMAEQGNAKAKFNLGFMYSNGQGVPQDYAEAVRWYRKPADQGDAGAQYNLGVMYSEGQGVTQDYAEAAKWFRKSAEQGHARAQNNLGVMSNRGYGVPQDYVQAHMWYNLAAAGSPSVEDRDRAAKNRDIVTKLMTPAEIAEAQSNLGVMYSNGQGVPQDYAEAAKWYRKSAEQGHASAQINLAFMYGNGQGVSHDYVQAHMWYNLAAASLPGEDRDRATKNRDIVAGLLTPAQIAEAQRLAGKWRPPEKPGGQHSVIDIPPGVDPELLEEARRRGLIPPAATTPGRSGAAPDN